MSVWQSIRAVFTRAADTIGERAAVAAIKAGYTPHASRLISSAPRRPEVMFRSSRAVLDEARRNRQAVTARELVQYSPVAESILGAMVDLVVGTGFVARSESPQREQYDKAFEQWSHSVDVEGRTLWEFQRAFFAEAWTEGDAAILLLGGKRMGVAGRVQLIPADAIRGCELTEADRNAIKSDGWSHEAGIVVDDVGRTRAVYINGARYDGEDVIFWRSRRRHPTQVRGSPAFESTFSLLHQLDRYIEASVVAARAAACVAGVVKSNNAGLMLSRMKSATGGGTSNTTERWQELQPGQIFYLQPGEDFSTVNPAQPSQQFDSVIRSILRLIGTAERLPLEMLLLDFSETNFSASRAAILQFKKRVQVWQDSLIYGPFDRLYRWWVSKNVKSGTLPASTDTAEMWSHTWTPPAWGYMDPQVEAQADAAAMDIGVKSFQQVAAEQGFDWRKRIEEISETLAFAGSKGVVIAGSTATRPTDQVFPTPTQETRKELAVGTIGAAVQIMQSAAIPAGQPGHLPTEQAQAALRVLIGVTPEQALEMVPPPQAAAPVDQSPIGGAT